MWARILEFMFACWLAMSPFIFHYPDEAVFLWTTDLVCSSLIAFFALICYYSHLQKMHLCSLLVAVYLIIIPYVVSSPSPYILQNYTVIGLLLIMTAIIPTDADKAPKPWRDFYRDNSRF